MRFYEHFANILRAHLERSAIVVDLHLCSSCLPLCTLRLLLYIPMSAIVHLQLRSPYEVLHTVFAVYTYETRHTMFE